MNAYKGFNKDMTCRDFQYKEGETYTCEEASLCGSGFHACENPIDCLVYYDPANGEDNACLNGGYGSALNGGYGSALNGGYGSALNGGCYSVIYGGKGAKVKGGMRSVLAIQYWQGYEFIRIAFAEVDGEKIKADTWYQLDENGEFVEVE